MELRSMKDVPLATKRDAVIANILVRQQVRIENDLFEIYKGQDWSLIMMQYNEGGIKKDISFKSRILFNYAIGKLCQIQHISYISNGPLKFLCLFNKINIFRNKDIV